MADTLTDTSQPDVGRHRAGRPALIRTDIQGLRAVAVTSVLLYHLWPNRLGGGFAGVDVFFVISGFLITEHLLAHPPTGPRGLLEFWSRRIRRLLPASLLVLLATVIASRIVAPETQWGATAHQVRAAALYVVNWRLADDAVDYLAAHNAASPVQHFWSLSVEEQFYLFWPVLILLVVVLARVFRVRLARAVPVVMLAVVAGSLAYSVHLTHTDPARAYFVTGTRIWELGIGGLLAALVSRRAFGREGEPRRRQLPPAPRAVGAWIGLAAIAVTVFTYTGRTPFPGWQALLPTLGAAAVIGADAGREAYSPGALLALRPVQWLGDISYSVYLWHWPLIVLVPNVSGDKLGRLDKAVIIAASIVLAALSKRYVEDTFRRGGWGRPLGKPFALAAVAMAIVVGASQLQTVEVQHRQHQAEVAVKRALAGHGTCFGAAALAAPAGRCKVTTSGPILPDPVQAAEDKSPAYAAVSHKKDCFAYLPRFPTVTCEFGRPAAPIRIALVGNSHAGQWVGALDAIARAEGWRLTTYLASQCAFADLPQTFPTGAQTQSCTDWVHRTSAKVRAGHYDLVIMTNRVSVPAVGETKASSQPLYAAAYQGQLAALRAAHERVLVLRDTPAPGQSVPDCLAAHSDDYGACDGSRKTWVPPEPVTTAVAALKDPSIVEADLTRYICEPTRCRAVVGGVVVYFDATHLTATYAKTLAPYLRPYIERALRTKP